MAARNDCDDLDGKSAIEICVCFEGVEKWITGVTKRTTCDDVVYALVHKRLQETRSSQRPLEAMRNFAVFIRNCPVTSEERPLIGRSKVLKILRSNGAQDITFVVRKYENKLTENTSKSTQGQSTFHRRLQRRKRNSICSDIDIPASFGASSTNQKPPQFFSDGVRSVPPVPAEYTELMQTIVRQERHISEQNIRLRDLDRYIDENAAYSDNKDDHSSSQEIGILKERIMTLDDRLAAEQVQVIRLTQMVSRERQTIEMNNEDKRFTDDDLRNELMELRKTFDHTVSLFSSYECEIADNARLIHEMDEYLARQNLELDTLNSKLSSRRMTNIFVQQADISSGIESGHGSNDTSSEFTHNLAPPYGAASYHHEQDSEYYGGQDARKTRQIVEQRPPRWVSPLVSPIQEFQKNVSKMADVDNNSDTGLSSMHSDEPIPNRVLETLV